VKQITKDWLEAASLDLKAVKHIIQDRRLTGHVAFHAQQAIEKSLKAVIEESGERVPKIHSLSKLFELCVPLISVAVNDDNIVALDSLYIESRYPGEFGLLPEGRPNLEQAVVFYEFALNIFETVREQLEQKK
jgi:HEPN domain-containing protein